MILSEEELKTLLINNEVEQRTLDYKLCLPGSTYEERKEFLADIVSFANSFGGTIIYGIGDARDAYGKSTGRPDFPLKGLGDINEDTLINSLENVIQNGISAKIHGIEFKLMKISNNVNDLSTSHSIETPGRDVTLLVVNIPQSWTSPHMVTLNGATRFYGRDSKGKYPMLKAVDIRNAFLMTEGLSEKIESFHAERINKIRNGHTPIDTKPSRPKVALHLIPLSAFKLPKPLVDVNELQEKETLLQTFDQRTASSRYNIDGYVQYSSDGPRSSYTQFFRNGIIETVGEYPFDIKCVRIKEVQDNIIRSFKNYLSAYIKLNISPPYLLYVALLVVDGFTFYTGDQKILDGSNTTNTIDRQAVVLPDILIEDYQPNFEQTFKPLFDALWNAAGWDRCYQYPWEGL
ncbi:MAG: hypothetical protein ACI9YB_001296 [Halioglobus sp.]|jgi:hypothetical protein